MSKGDDYWRVRNWILKLLYHEGRFYEKSPIPSQASFKKQVMKKVEEAGLDVSEHEIEEVFVWLYQDELITSWSGGGADKLWLTRKGLQEAREIPERQAMLGEGKAFH